jgi:hypothetical protein
MKFFLARCVALFVAPLLGCSGADFKVGVTNGDDSAVGTDATDVAGDGVSVEGSPPVAFDAPAEAVAPAGCTDTSCAGGHYCAKVCGLATGTCKARPAPSSDYDPVCGCDGVTYWNLAHAVSKGQGTKATGPCPLIDASKCSLSTACPGGATCVLAVTSEGDCTSSTRSGQCWQIPATTTCAGAPSAVGAARTCGSGGCMSLCEAVKSGETLWDVGCAL